LQNGDPFVVDRYGGDFARLAESQLLDECIAGGRIAG
jgi:hypothetical protein